jgi:hypothetical protein
MTHGVIWMTRKIVTGRYSTTNSATVCDACSSTQHTTLSTGSDAQTDCMLRTQCVHFYLLN